MTGLQMDEHIARIALNQGATPQTKTYLTDALGSEIAIAKADQSLEITVHGDRTDKCKGTRRLSRVLTTKIK